MDLSESQFSICLHQWNRGDASALDRLLEDQLPWLRNYVRKRMGPILRNKGETSDYVQDALMEFLRYGPKVEISSERHFKALLVRITENSLRGRYDWFTAHRRRISRERPLPSDTILSLDPPADKETDSPSRVIQKNEDEAWVRLGVEILDAADRDIVVMRQWERRSFVQIGEALGINSDAARKRHDRALGRLGEKVCLLRQGKLDQVFDETEETRD